MMGRQFISREEFGLFGQREWQRVQLDGAAIPEILRKIPEELKPVIYASGTLGSGMVYTGKGIKLGELIGGIDVFREDTNDDPYLINKDHYVIVDIGHDTLLFVGKVSPESTVDHWVKSIPPEYTCSIIVYKGDMSLKSQLRSSDEA